MSKPVKVKPCPFCGSGDAGVWGWAATEEYNVHCDNCEAAGPTRKTVTLAKRAWNTRKEAKA